MREKLWIRLYLLLFVSIGAIIAVGYRFKLSWNMSPSLPLGIWSQSAAVDVNMLKGKVVSFCPPDTPLFRDARERGILKWGRCPAGFAPLLKRVVATSGDIIGVDEVVTIGGKPLDHCTVIKKVAAFYRAAPVFRRLLAGELWVMGDTDDSFDSRYFGAIDASTLVGVQDQLF